ncbi:MAG: hypothetical protein EPN20_05310 [Magnetospirillum sp.]|nr:MAG: hypothetical protein EPN20_05310 [Magnetospirillum sp.]
MVSAHRKMDARDFIWLAALGMAARTPSSLNDICNAIDGIAGPSWAPVTEVVLGCVEEMVRGGNLRETSDQDGVEEVFAITDQGRQTLSLLMAQPIDCPINPLGQVGLRLKLAFIDLMPTAERRHQLERVICSLEGELASRERHCDACPGRGSFGRLWRDLDTDRLRREIMLLRTFAGPDAPPVAFAISTSAPLSP